MKFVVLSLLAGFAATAPCAAQAVTGAEKTTGSGAAVPAPKRVVIPRLHGPVTIDGELGESTWARAAELGPFSISATGVAEREKTWVKAWYDDQALYLGWTCVDADIQATFTARDSKFWEEEVAEFFVSPDVANGYYELQWNPLGGVFDAAFTHVIDAKTAAKRRKSDHSFTAKGMTSAVKVRGTVQQSADADEQWRVEVRIPFADFGRSAPKPGEVWRGNFYRFNRHVGRAVEELAWSPTRTPHFHVPERFGYLEFGH